MSKMERCHGGNFLLACLMQRRRTHILDFYQRVVTDDMLNVMEAMSAGVILALGQELVSELKRQLLLHEIYRVVIVVVA